MCHAVVRGTLARVPWLVTDDARVLASADIADDRASRRRGLRGRDGLEGALVLRPCRWVHTIGMRFPIDVVYLWRDNRVLKIVHAMRCCRVSACWSARSVLEMPAGWAEAHDLRAGRTLTFHDIAP